MTEIPDFTVILATYNRGHCIAPTIRSALYQSHASFELLVIGDGCTDDTESAVRSFDDPRIRWQNIKRGGSQSYPNNAGIAQARGRFLAYLGHDDIWAPDHLARLYRCFLADDNVSFAVSGCLLHGPPDSGIHEVTGLVTDTGEERTYFFPPTSFAHRKDVTTIVGPWRDPGDLSVPVDSDLLLRSVAAGLVFAFSGAITAHKFTASWHYLSYIVRNARNQENLLSLLREERARSFVESAIASARSRGAFNRISCKDYENRQVGEIYHHALSVRGLTRPPLKTLSRSTRIVQTDEHRGNDWYEYRNQPVALRWSGENPRPRLLIPYTSGSLVGLAVIIVAASGAGIVGKVRLSLNGETQSHQRLKGTAGSVIFTWRGRLKSDDYSVLQFDLMNAHSSVDPHFPHGRIAVGDILLAPLDHRQNLQQVPDTVGPARN